MRLFQVFLPIHLDVKPSNFLIRQREATPDHPDLLLADFGISRFHTATATASQSIRGTPLYMAPEQWTSSSVPATDQYALAIMAYQLLTRTTPFQWKEPRNRTTQSLSIFFPAFNHFLFRNRGVAQPASSSRWP